MALLSGDISRNEGGGLKWELFFLRIDLYDGYKRQEIMSELQVICSVGMVWNSDVEVDSKSCKKKKTHIKINMEF